MRQTSRALLHVTNLVRFSWKFHSYGQTCLANFVKTSGSYGIFAQHELGLVLDQLAYFVQKLGLPGNQKSGYNGCATCSA